MIRTLVAHGGALVRGALAFALGAQDDIEVVGQIGRYEEVAGAVWARHPQVTVLDFDLLPPDDLPGLTALHRTVPDQNLVVLADAHRSALLAPMLAQPAPGLGFVAKDGPLRRLVAAVRQVANGELVLDPELVVSALRTSTPLTPRETQVLSVAAEGRPVNEIAARLCLSPGTVRNHLSRVIGKTGARTRIEAVKLARDAGWI